MKSVELTVWAIKLLNADIRMFIANRCDIFDIAVSNPPYLTNPGSNISNRLDCPSKNQS